MSRHQSNDLDKGVVKRRIGCQAQQVRHQGQEKIRRFIRDSPEDLGRGRGMSTGLVIHRPDQSPRDLLYEPRVVTARQGDSPHGGRPDLGLLAVGEREEVTERPRIFHRQCDEVIEATLVDCFVDTLSRVHGRTP
jgi:hypothetical protein